MYVTYLFTGGALLTGGIVLCSATAGIMGGVTTYMIADTVLELLHAEACQQLEGYVAQKVDAMNLVTGSPATATATTMDGMCRCNPSTRALGAPPVMLYTSVERVKPIS